MGRFVIAVVAASVTSTALANELKWTHFGVRPLAMGNAYVAVADDYNALFYNPAGLARLKEWSGEFLNPGFEVSNATVKFFKDAQKLARGSAGSVTSVLDLLENNTGKTQHFAINLTPHLVSRGWGLGLGVDLNTTLAFHRDISAEVDFGPRIIAPIAFATNFLDNRLSLGASIKAVARGGVDREFSINDIDAFTNKKSSSTDDSAATDGTKKSEISDFFEGGIGIGTDFGLLFTPVKTMEPTLGISVTDLGGTPYKEFDIGGNALGAPATRLPAVNTGVSLMPYSANNMFVRTSVDAHAINQPVHFSKKWNLGLEWGYSSIIKLQTGLHQGELTAGLEFDVFLFSFRFATYAEQLGSIAGQDDDLSDRRYVWQVKLLF